MERWQRDEVVFVKGVDVEDGVADLLRQSQKGAASCSWRLCTLMLMVREKEAFWPQ